MIVIEGTIRAADLGRALPAMSAMVAASRAEPGCIAYAYATDILDPTLVHVSERWTDRQALAAHLESAHLKEWRARWTELGITDRALRLYEAHPEPF